MNNFLLELHVSIESVLRGTLGGSEHHNTAEKFAKINTAISQNKNRKIPQYNTMSKLNVILKPLYCTLSLEQITREQKLTFGNVRFRQNKQNK